MSTNATSNNNEHSELLDRGNAFLYNGNLPEALKCFIDYLERSQDGSGLTHNKIGQIYSNLSQPKESFMWFKKSAELNCAYGMVNTAKAYENGVGTDKNIYEALRYYIQAYSIDKGYSKRFLDNYLLNNLCSIYELGVNLTVAIDYDFEFLVNTTQEGVDKGDPHSILRLGYMYLYGIGIEKSMVKARDLFLKINEGPYYPSALNFLGDLYYFGCNSILQDYSKALSYWRKSAQFRYPLAYFNLGQAYNFGWGVEQNPFDAIDYYKMADIGQSWNKLGMLANQNYDYADRISGGDLTQSNCAFLCFKKSAELGSVRGMLGLAQTYASGYSEVGFEKNPGQTYFWVERAALYGNVNAICNLGDWYSSYVNPPDKLKALEFYQKAAKAGSEQAKARIAELGIDTPIAENTIENSYEELQKLIGLNNVKTEIESVINEAKIAKEMKDRGLSDNRGTCHMVFTGNPGTGKTVVARLVASIFKEYGILSKGQLIEVDRSKLVASYVGQTTTKTQGVINLALGGILFIDEAYTLFKDSDNDYGQEAIDTILKAMEDHRDDFVVIVAGYTNEMFDFIHSNPGLESRFRRTIHFDDYSAKELMDIFIKNCNDNGYKYDDKTGERVNKIIRKMVDFKTETFANAREVRNLYEDIIRNQRNRLAKDNNEHTTEDLLTIKLEDLPIDKLDSEHDIDAYMQELNSLIGLDTVKDEISELADLIEIQKDRKEMGLDSQLPSLHMVFTGNPGTGKTTVARLISKMYSSLGVLSKGTLTEVSRADLVAGYTGQTAIKTKNVIAKSIGGVLFIDEAYTLHQSDDDSFGQEAIDTLLKEMEDHRNNLAVIIAGYTNDIKDFVESNEGLASRFNRYIEFDDYSVEQLVSIFINKCNSEKYSASDDLLDELKEYLKSIDMSKFGNGRGIRNLFEKIIPQQAKRLLSEKRAGRILNEMDYKELKAADLLSVIEKNKTDNL